MIWLLKRSSQIYPLSTFVKTINLMFDGWTDRHHAIHYLGLRVQFITNDWKGKVVTLSVKPCAGDSESVSDHIRKELVQFVPSYKQKVLFCTHDGASVMKKVSKLLNVTDYLHCVAHCINLLLTTDSITRVPAIVALLQKCKIKVVNTLHFKTEIMEAEVLTENDIIARNELLDKINDIKCVLDAGDNIIDDAEDIETDTDQESDDVAGRVISNVESDTDADNVEIEDHEFEAASKKMKKVHRLQNEVIVGLLWGVRLDICLPICNGFLF